MAYLHPKDTRPSLEKLLSKEVLGNTPVDYTGYFLF